MPRQISEKDNFSFLLWSLLFLLFGSTVETQFLQAHTLHVIIATMVLSMIIGIWSIRNRRWAFNTGLGLTITVLLVALVTRLLNVLHLEVVTILLILSFFVLTLKYAGEQIFKPGIITGNKLYGSVCVFLLLGLIWSMLYLLLIEVLPGSFSGVPEDSWLLNFSGMTYFSFVTLTTLGFGEIVPLTPIARFLVYTEAVVGILYIAIFVSSLIGLGVSYNIDQTKE